MLDVSGCPSVWSSGTSVFPVPLPELSDLCSCREQQPRALSIERLSLVPVGGSMTLEDDYDIPGLAHTFTGIAMEAQYTLASEHAKNMQTTNTHTHTHTCSARYAAKQQ